MKGYLLFIDTETSGIPKRWNRPFSDQKNWPSVIQLAWIVYLLDGTEVKRVSKYIFEEDIVISPDSQKVHGISTAHLKEQGDRRKNVLRKLAYDIKKYSPLIIGHFLELDIQVLSADFYRAQLHNPFLDQTFFCTMLESKKYALNPVVGYLRLVQLHEELFDERPLDLHEAERDAEITARCFFELWRRNDITEQDFIKQQSQFLQKLNFADKLKV
ncbi:3'-5' exonuclease [Sphingobacterium deserti]|uniref:Exonuclease RNase T and DNA polymerase III n=1 Tax=Sphingobacterium deserti TaxID=1229276 RepID=A0A0B8T1A0_9SPHI|nr:3'-5' exonuclease [Sphingobacterium deserti]KGE12448.1 exonuclease RNase T and DNA polymerase III [Sphingobacterium deserti]